MIDAGRLASWPWWTNGPMIFIQNHVYELSQDSVVRAVKSCRFCAAQITTTCCEFYPDSGLLSFTFRVTHLTNKVSRIPTFPPSLADVRTNGTRRATHLVRKRVLLLRRKRLRQLEYLHSRIHRRLIHAQLLITSNVLQDSEDLDSCEYIKPLRCVRSPIHCGRLRVAVSLLPRVRPSPLPRV